MVWRKHARGIASVCPQPHAVTAASQNAKMQKWSKPNGAVANRPAVAKVVRVREMRKRKYGVVAFVAASS